MYKLVIIIQEFQCCTWNFKTIKYILYKLCDLCINYIFYIWIYCIHEKYIKIKYLECFSLALAINSKHKIHLKPSFLLKILSTCQIWLDHRFNFKIHLTKTHTRNKKVILLLSICAPIVLISFNPLFICRDLFNPFVILCYHTLKGVGGGGWGRENSTFEHNILTT